MKFKPDGTLYHFGPDYTSISRKTEGGFHNMSDHQFFVGHNGVPPPQGRYEDKLGRYARTAQVHRQSIEKLVGPVWNCFDLSPEQGSLPTFITMMSTSSLIEEIKGENEKFPDRRSKLVVEKFKAKFPAVKFRPMYPVYTVTPGSKTEVSISAATSMVPVVVEGIPGVPFAVFFRAETPYGNSDVAVDAWLLTSNLAEVSKVLEFLDSILAIYKEVAHLVREISVYGRQGGIELDEQTWTTWDEVFLDPEVAKSVREDLQFFMNNEALFRKVGLPYKRGYLMCGPPGNGKSTICRAIATSMPVAAFMFDFSNQDMGNSDLTNAFQWAAENAPAVFFLEDIDRIYGAEDEKDKANVTLDHLLNCLDGIATNNGVVVVATANNPEKLDPAILSRPGRFDKVVMLKDPDTALRKRYLAYLFRFTAATEGDIKFLADETEGLSMAFLKEVFLVTASRSIIAGEEMTRTHMEGALDAIFAQFDGISRKGRRKAGFGA